MADENTPVNIFSPTPELEAVVGAIRALPGVVRCEPDGPDTQWLKIHVAIDDARGRRELIVHHDPQYWAPASLERQVAGMQGFYGQFGIDRFTGPMLESLDVIGFAVGVMGDNGQPHPYPSEQDPAGRLTQAIAVALDGLVFSSKTMYDHRWRVVLGPAPDADATPPAWMPHPPDDARVARRLVALTAMYLRSDLERMDDPAATREEWRDRLATWVRDADAWDELEPDEVAALGAPIGSLDQQVQLDLEWRIEGAAVLAWALGLMPAPSDDAVAEPVAVVEAIGGLDEPPVAVVRQAQVRSNDELAAAQKHLFFWHWRFVDHQVNPRTFDFGAFGATAWFGGFGPDEFRLVNGDLAIGDRPIAAADPDVVGTFNSAALERHTAINWLRAGRLYSETSQDT